MSRGVNSINEGEGNKTAAHEYNKAQRRFVKRGAVEAQAEAADGPEAPELAKAEIIGKSHIAEEDRQVRRDYHEQVKRRAYDIWEEEGRPHGRDREHWHRAETELKKS